MLRECSVGAPEELFDVLRVIDGDTLWIEREGQREKLRLLSVDTEEKFMERELSPSKPSTRYGDLVTGWTQGFVPPRSPEEGPVRVGLRFPGRVEQRVCGRLLYRGHRGRRGLQPAPRPHGLGPYFNSATTASITSASQRSASHGRSAACGCRHQQERKKRPCGDCSRGEARGAAVPAFRELAAADPPTGSQPTSPRPWRCP